MKNKKNAVLWPYRYGNFGKCSWEKGMRYICSALRNRGYDILQHPKFTGEYGAQRYDGRKECDIAIYNHAVASEIRGNIIKAKRTWFFKSTVPDQRHFTLDTLGHGSCASIGQTKPDFQSISEGETEKFFSEQVPNWITERSSKWGSFKHQDVREKDFVLFLTQVPTDETVNRMWWGEYTKTLIKAVEAFLVYSDKPIIVKLHPYTDGTQKRTEYVKKNCTENAIKMNLGLLAQRHQGRLSVYTGLSSVHCFFKKADLVCVCNSSSGIEAMMHGLPVISWGFPEYHWVTYDWRNWCLLPEALKLKWFDRKKQDQWLCWYLTKHCITDEESASRRISELLLEK